MIHQHPEDAAPGAKGLKSGAIDFNYSKPFLGIQVPIVIGIGGLLVGGLLMLWAWANYRGFFSRGLEAARPDALERPPAEKAIA
jgi:hypothetical protein